MGYTVYALANEQLEIENHQEGFAINLGSIAINLGLVF
jgi:hypothetical protein